MLKLTNKLYEIKRICRELYMVFHELASWVRIEYFMSGASVWCNVSWWDKEWCPGTLTTRHGAMHTPLPSKQTCIGILTLVAGGGNSAEAVFEMMVL